MEAVKGHTLTTLLLTEHYLPHREATAMAAFNLLYKGRIKAIDKNGNLCDWLQWNNMSERGYGVEYLDTQPSLASAFRAWPVPTIGLTTSRFYRKVRSGSQVPRKMILKKYEYTCQLCWQVFRGENSSFLTIEHVKPKSLGGTNEWSNLSVTCRSCNHRKGSKYPYYDIHGKPLNAKKIYATGFFMPEKENIRKEWEPYLFTEDDKKQFASDNVESV